MADDVTIVTREVVFEQVWSMPMTKLAKGYGVSDVALRKTCRKEDIPLPAQGHWNKAPDHRTRRRPTLPPADGGPPALHLPVQPTSPIRRSRPVPGHWRQGRPGSRLRTVFATSTQRLEIYAYTCAEDGKVTWTPLMLLVVDVFYELYDTPRTDESRKDTVSRIPIDYPPKEAVEFLYLQGADGNWNWGQTGGLNAAFIQNGARDYFRQFS